MDVLTIADKFIVLRGTKDAETKYRKEVSKRIIEKFGKGPFVTEIIAEILIFCQQYFISEFEAICQEEKSYLFFKDVFWLHENAAELRRSEHFHTLPEGLDKAYIGGYRRVLKMILEQGCVVEMVTGEKRNELFKKRSFEVLNNLLFLGEMIYRFGESIAEQKMVEDITDITFDSHNLYHLERRHHYESIFAHITKELEKTKDDFIIDPAGETDFKDAVLRSTGIDYDKLKEVIYILYVHFELEPGDCLSASRDNFIKDICSHTTLAPAVVEEFLSGLTLTKENKLSITELIRRPHSLNRYLYRPLLLWSINGKPFYILGLHSLFEAENSLVLNAIPWGKFPQEWEQWPTFKEYVDRKKDAHDKWLDDKVEEIIKDCQLMYDRKVVKLTTKKTSYKITGKNLGEIDFLIISPVTKKILVTECKHLVGRYDMVNWQQDFEHFTKDGKTLSYNSRIKEKVKWLQQNMDVLEQHFQRKYEDPSLNLKDYTVEGIFIINTPTFYMYNADFRIYTFHHLRDVLLGEYEDPTFLIWIDGDEHLTSYSIKYPYFRKPKMLYYEYDDDDEEVDKYGYPIKKTPET